MRVGIFDLECTSLEAVGPGMLLCCVVKELDGETRILRYDDAHCKIGHERDLVRAVNNELKKYDMLVGFNHESFDLRWLLSRSLALDLDFDLSPFSYDLYRASNRLGFRTALNYKGHPKHSLAFVIDYFAIPQEKGSVYPRSWWNAVWLTGEKRKDALDAIVLHCVADVNLTEKLYKRILPLDKRATIRRWSV